MKNGAAQTDRGECLKEWSFDDYVRCLATAGDGGLLCGGYDGKVSVLALP